MKSFYEIDWHDFQRSWDSKIEEEVKSQDKDYILQVDEKKYCNYLFEKYTLEPLEILEDSEHIYEPIVRSKFITNNWGDKYEREIHYFKIEYHFEGSSILFKVKPTHWTVCFYEIKVNDNLKKVSFEVSITNLSKEEFLKEKNDCYRDAFVNLENINSNIQPNNNRLYKHCCDIFKKYKGKHIKENSFFEAVNIRTNKNTKSVFTAPTIQKKIIPQPKANAKKEFSSEPAMSKVMYDDILKVIYDSGKNMEKKPSLYKGKDEEALRDQFLFVLETRYEGTTATGETFNKLGKTDIILKYAKDSSNLFVAECKFWHGASEYKKAINQLFDRYLTWRDSKVSVIVFVKNKDFSNVISTIKSETKNHPYFLKDKGERGETSLSYEFHLPDDKEKAVYLEIMAFHYI